MDAPDRWVRTPEELADFARALEGAPAIAIDTESDSFYHYYEKVCLLQIADSRGPVGLVDPLVLRDLGALGPILASPDVEKVLHAAENDVALLKRDFDLRFSRIFDTHAAARLCGRLEFGLQALLERDVGVRLSKDMQRCDWSRRPLQPAQERYAADDVRHLFALRDRLRSELRALGREAWAQEEGEALAATEAAPRREPTDFMRLKGARDLAPRARSVLKELVELREAWARRSDLPLFKIMGDEVLVLLAEYRPHDAGGLGRIRGLPARVRERRSAELFEAIRRGEAAPPYHPPRRERLPARMTPAARGREARLKAWRVQAAERVKLDPGVLLPQRLIEAIAIAGPGDREGLFQVTGLRRWRAETFGAEILSALGS
ncbi:MAG TPA: HRDC domain-containing protein [Planctomycetota bacterium]|nr:HRDC domain-containing protein [Planctomycetota bacterium]